VQETLEWLLLTLAQKLDFPVLFFFQSRRLNLPLGTSRSMAPKLFITGWNFKTEIKEENFFLVKFGTSLMKKR